MTDKTEKMLLDEANRTLCDEVVARAASMMVDKVGASIPMMLDRLLTYAAAQMCSMEGSAKTAEAFRILAINVEQGAFDRITGENRSGAGTSH